ncbi:MAG: ribosomal protein L7/L12 [Planctomycetota bacterium]|nr:ribosomal protein L7/L12 [Planctomycetota bacterium]
MESELTDAQWTEIEGHLQTGHKIQAIKLFRDFTGVGLKEAKDAVEAYEAELRQQFPERFAAGSGKSGVGLSALITAFNDRFARTLGVEKGGCLSTFIWMFLLLLAFGGVWGLIGAFRHGS